MLVMEGPPMCLRGNHSSMLALRLSRDGEPSPKIRGDTERRLANAMRIFEKMAAWWGSHRASCAQPSTRIVSSRHVRR